MSELAKNSNVQNCVNSKANCVHYIYRMFGCVEKLNIQNSENSTGNCVSYISTECQISKKIECPKLLKFYWKIYIICTKSLELQKNRIFRTV